MVLEIPLSVRHLVRGFVRPDLAACGYVLHQCFNTLSASQQGAAEHFAGPTKRPKGVSPAISGSAAKGGPDTPAPVCFGRNFTPLP